MNYDFQNEHDCFAALGKFIVRFSALDTGFTNVSERLIATIDQLEPPLCLSEEERVYDKRTSKKLQRLTRIVTTIDVKSVFSKEFSRWRSDVNVLTTIRDDICHGHCSLSLNHDDPTVFIHTSRRNAAQFQYYLAATEVDILSHRIGVCYDWLYHLNSQAICQYLERDNQSLLSPYPTLSIASLFPDRRWENPPRTPESATSA